LRLRNLGFDIEPNFEQWSHDHQARAEELIKTANNINYLKTILRDRKNADKKTAICSTEKEDKCYTYSAFIFDTKNCSAYYCKGNPLHNQFKKYKL